MVFPKIKVSLWFLLIGSLFVLSGCSKAPVEEPVKVDLSNYVAYENKADGFSLQHPKDWTIKEGETIDADMRTLVTLIAPLVESSAKKSPKLLTVGLDTSIKDSAISLEEYFKRELSSLHQVQDYNPELIADVQISGIPAKKIIYSSSEDGIQWKFIQAFFIKGDQAYVFTALSEKDQFESVRNDFEAIIASFQFDQ